MLETLSQYDASLVVWLNSFHNTFFDNIMYLASNRWMWVPMYVVLFAVTLMHFGLRKRTLAVLALFAITITLADTVCADYIRPFFSRPRPTQPDSGISTLIHTVNGYRGGHYGMASCHSANSFAPPLGVHLYLGRATYLHTYLSGCALSGRYCGGRLRGRHYCLAVIPSHSAFRKS